MARAARQCSGCMSSCPGIPACCARGVKSGTAGLGQLSGNRFLLDAEALCFTPNSDGNTPAPRCNVLRC